MRTLLVIALIVPGLGLLGGATSEKASPWGYYVAAQGDCDVGSCSTGCNVNNVEGHMAPAAGVGDSTKHEGTQHAGCFAGINCASIHPPCGGSATFAPLIGPARSAVLVSLIEDAARGEVSAVTRMFSEFPTFVSFNRERSSLQVRSCNRSTIISTIPLSVRQRGVLKI